MTTSNWARRSNHAVSIGVGALVAALLASVAMPCEKTVSATDDVPSVKVSYGDLNLASDAGVKVLQRRIIAAAKQVCAHPDPRNLSAVVASRACQSQAIERATEEVRAPVMAANDLHAK